MKKVSFSILLLSLTSLFFNGCSSSETFDSEVYPLQKLILIPAISEDQLNEFNRNIESEFTSVKEENGLEISGYRTSNKIFLEKVITPLVAPHLEKLSQMNKVDIINYLTLFSFEIYQRYFGKSFYRWGGDILDLDDPQEKGVRSKFAFGLDCSGFVAIPYELAVYFGLISADHALFSSMGYEKYCLANAKQDVGGRDGTGNNFRLDTQELAELGEEVFRLEKGQNPTEEQIKLLKPGDIAGRSGHFGIIAKINNEPYYLESGGWAVPRNNGVPVKADEALKIFASTGPLTIRRCLN